MAEKRTGGPRAVEDCFVWDDELNKNKIHCRPSEFFVRGHGGLEHTLPRSAATPGCPVTSPSALRSRSRCRDAWSRLCQQEGGREPAGAGGARGAAEPRCGRRDAGFRGGRYVFSSFIITWMLHCFPLPGSSHYVWSSSMGEGHSDFPAASPRGSPDSGAELLVALAHCSYISMNVG